MAEYFCDPERPFRPIREFRDCTCLSFSSNLDMSFDNVTYFKGLGRFVLIPAFTMSCPELLDKYLNDGNGESGIFETSLNSAEDLLLLIIGITLGSTSMGNSKSLPTAAMLQAISVSSIGALF